MALKINEQAPDFTLPSTSGKDLTLSKDLVNKPCIIYFYPKDFTSVCTKEACAFRDEFAAFREVDIEVYGISRDDIPTHQKFKEQHQLPFDLLSDKSGKVCKAYSALVPIIGLPKRITYLLNKDHRIAGVFQDMFSADKHIKRMIEKVNTKSYL